MTLTSSRLITISMLALTIALGSGCSDKPPTPQEPRTGEYLDGVTVIDNIVRPSDSVPEDQMLIHTTNMQEEHNDDQRIQLEVFKVIQGISPNVLVVNSLVAQDNVIESMIISFEVEAIDGYDVYANNLCDKYVNYLNSMKQPVFKYNGSSNYTYTKSECPDKDSDYLKYTIAFKPKKATAL